MCRWPLQSLVQLQAIPRLAARPHLSAAATIGIAVFTVVLMGLSISKLGTYSPFLYFQF